MHLLKVLINREEANPIVSQGMASDEEGTVA